MNRRSFLKRAVGATVLADAAWELSGNSGLFRYVFNGFSYLSRPIKNPSYNITSSLDNAEKQCFVPYIKSILDNFDKAPSNDDIADQVAFFKSEKKYDPTKVLVPATTGGQALLLPMQPENNRYFFVTVNHLFDDPGFKNNSLYIGNSRISSITLLVSSEDCDLAFGYCRGSDPVDVKSVPFTNNCRKGDNVIIIPCLDDKVRKRVSGKVSDINKSFLLSNTSVVQGHSGSPMVVDGRVAGFSTKSLNMLFTDYSIGIRAKHLEDMLRFYVRGCK